MTESPEVSDEQPSNEAPVGKPYSVSKSANATEAPTSGVTEQALNAKLYPAGLTPDENDFVQFMAQYYTLHGELLNVNDCEQYQFEQDEFIKLMTSPNVQVQLIERGVVIRPATMKMLQLLADPQANTNEANTDTEVNPNDPGAVGGTITSEPIPLTWKDKTLSPLQYVTANMMLDMTDQRSEKKKLQDLGVSTQTYAMWKRDPVFNEYIMQRAELVLDDSLPDIHMALADKARMGDVSAIKFLYEMTGRYKQETASGAAGTSQISDFRTLLIQILEIINEEVDDPETAIRIGERFKLLTTMHQSADALMSIADSKAIGLTNVAAKSEPSFIQPEVMPARQLSPRLKALMEKGEIGAE